MSIHPLILTGNSNSSSVIHPSSHVVFVPVFVNGAFGCINRNVFLMTVIPSSRPTSCCIIAIINKDAVFTVKGKD